MIYRPRVASRSFSLATQTLFLRIGQLPKQVQPPNHSTKYLQVHRGSEIDNWIECSNGIVCLFVMQSPSSCGFQYNLEFEHWETGPRPSVRDRWAPAATHEDGPWSEQLSLTSCPIQYSFSTHFRIGNHDLKTEGLVIRWRNRDDNCKYLVIRQESSQLFRDDRFLKTGARGSWKRFEIKTGKIVRNRPQRVRLVQYIIAPGSLDSEGSKAKMIVKWFCSNRVFFTIMV